MLDIWDMLSNLKHRFEALDLKLKQSIFILFQLILIEDALTVRAPQA